MVSVLSVEPWLVEPLFQSPSGIHQSVSVLSVEPWLVEPRRRPGATHSLHSFSALSRAVVGGTRGLHDFYDRRLLFQCSQSSRGWWNRLVRAVASMMIPFQCSQSSRGWWNHLLNVGICQCVAVSVLSVEPWLVEPNLIFPSRRVVFAPFWYFIAAGGFLANRVPAIWGGKGVVVNAFSQIGFC